MNEIALMREIAKLQGQIDSLRTIEVGGVWQDWTPATSNITVGNGTLTGRYCAIGKFCRVNISFTLGSTSSITGYQIYGLPFTSTNYVWTSNAFALNDGIGWYQGMCIYHDSTSLRIETIGGGWWSGTHPIAFAENDIIVINHTYEIA